MIIEKLLTGPTAMVTAVAPASAQTAACMRPATRARLVRIPCAASSREAEMPSSVAGIYIQCKKNCREEKSKIESCRDGEIPAATDSTDAR